MAAIGGVVGWGDERQLQQLVDQSLAAQYRYGLRRPAVSRVKGAAIGIVSDLPNEIPVTSSARWVLVVDARIDNRAEISRRLNCPPGLSNAKLLLESWIRGGESCLDWIIGDFAFAVYDGAVQRLTLVRDPAAQYPLFYRQDKGLVRFASMPCGLASPTDGLRVNKLKLARSLAGIFPNDELTFFECVERVRPGEIVCFELGRITKRNYWNPSLEPLSGISDGEWVERYRHLLDRAVECRLPKEPECVGTHLSSGYDSSAVTTTAARLVGPGRLHAFTSAPVAGFRSRLPRSRVADESQLACETAKLYGLHHVVVRETDPLMEVIRLQGELTQEPVLSAFNSMWWFRIRRLARELGATTLLTALQGNLTLNYGGLSVLSDLVRQRQWRNWLREAWAATRRPDVRLRGVLINSFGPGLPAQALSGFRQLFLNIPPVKHVSFLESDLFDQLCSVGGASSRPSGSTTNDRLRGFRISDPGCFRKGSLADCGVDERDPTADRRLIEFGLTLPPDQLLRNGISRPLARRALADRVPETVLDARKRGLQAADWYLRVNRQNALSALEEISSNSTVTEMLDIPRMALAIAEWPTGNWNSGKIVAKYRMSLINALSAGMFVTQTHQMAVQRPADSFPVDVLPTLSNH